MIALGVDPAGFREPQSIDDPPYALAPDLDLPLDRLHHLVWANNYDARSGEPVWWWGEKAARLGAVVGGVRRRRPPRRARRLDRRRSALERSRHRGGADRGVGGRRRPARAGAARPFPLAGRARPRPARRRRAPRWPGPRHRPRRLRQDEGPDRADASPAGRSRLPPRGRDRRRLQQARPERARDAPAGAGPANADAQLTRVLAPQPSSRQPRPCPQRAGGARRHRPGLPDPEAAPHQHRSGRPLPGRPDRLPARSAAAGRGRGDAGRRPRVRRRVRPLPRAARRRGRDRLRRADLRGARGAAPRRRVPAPGPARAPPPARRRVPGPDPGPRADDPPALDARIRRLRGRRRRPDDLRPRRRRPAVPRRLRRVLPRRRAGGARGQLPLRRGDRRRRREAARLQPDAGREDDPSRRRGRSRPGRAGDPHPARPPRPR